MYRLKVQHASLVKNPLLSRYLAELSSLNFSLHAELKEALKKQLEALPFVPLETDIAADEGIVRNLQEQLQLANQEKEQAIELWQTVLQEHAQLQQQYEERGTETQIHVAESQKQKVIFMYIIVNFEMFFYTSHQQFLKTVTQQNVELEQLQKQLRSELSQQKLRNQELTSQLEMANEKVTEDEKLMVEYREYINRLQRRLSHAEQRAATASQKVQNKQKNMLSKCI
uniref:Sodium channel and clathrin linker 1 n=1 Tax=Strix occidentalis caurina TaxID=311401 RepID=A0A8D0FZG0_STROC